MKSDQRAGQILLSGWGRYPVGRSRFVELDDFAEFRAEQDERIVRGNARSYGDASFLSGGTTFGMLPQDRMIEFDSDSGVLRAQGGVTLEEILRMALPRGWFLPVTPGTKYPTLAGSVACDIHGKNHHVSGNISNFVEKLRLILANGDEVECSPTSDPELFWATCGGMGLTGLISEVTLRLKRVQSSYVSVRYDKCANLDQVMTLLQEAPESFHYSVAWIDCLSRGKALGRSILMRGDHATVDQLAESQLDDPLSLKQKPRVTVPLDAPGFLLNPFTIRAFNTVYYEKLRQPVKTALQDYDSFFYPLDSLLDWNRLYGSRGFVQYQCVLPYATAHRGLVELLEAFSQSRRASFLAVLKTMGAESGPLAFPLPGFTLALDIPMTGEDLLDLFEGLDSRVAELGGRIYLAKDARMKPQPFRRMYPRLDEWLAVKRRVDPQNRFRSDLSRRLEIF